MGSDFLVSHKAPNVGHYQSGGDERREKDREEGEAIPSKGVGPAKSRSCHSRR